ncbi:MAG TPA: hypothetical protein VNT01_10225 [Symbiobacteriaceae bacterium]|nr:hypothetical protein [Symbiobacteriaceae bacterium]
MSRKPHSTTRWAWILRLARPAAREAVKILLPWLLEELESWISSL